MPSSGQILLIVFDISSSFAFIEYGASLETYFLNKAKASCANTR